MTSPIELMAAAVRKREIAVAGRERWQVKVAAADAEIAAIAAQLTTPSVNGAAPAVAVPSANGTTLDANVPPDYAETAQ